MGSTVLEITDRTFDGLIASETPTLVDFWAPWCGPCRALAPTLERLADRLGDDATVAKLNVDEHPEIAARFGISSIPMVLVFKGGEVIETIVGLRDEDTYARTVGVAHGT